MPRLRSFRSIARLLLAGAVLVPVAAAAEDDGDLTSAVVGFALGDFTFDGRVDAADYTVWRDSVGPQDPEGDTNLDGSVDQLDYQLWVDNFGVEIASLAIGVPEPLTATLLALGVAGVSPRRSRR